MAKSKIIKDIVNNNVNIVTTLKRLSVLVYGLNNSEILNWINCEISGYPENEYFPSYRKIRGSVKGYYSRNDRTWKDNFIPLVEEISMKDKENIIEFKIREGIAALNELSNQYGEICYKHITPDLFHIIAKYSGDRDIVIKSARVVIDKHIIIGILSNVEKRILDILLMLEQEFGCLDDLDIDTSSKDNDAIKKFNEKINVIIYNNNSISIGDGNKITSSTLASNINGEPQN